MTVPPKPRTPVPPDVSAAVMFASDRTCCVCRQPGLAVQIHHLDEDPTNHDMANLAVLCLQDHNLTQVRGGFGKALTAAEVRTHRDDWLERVRARRARADELAAQAMARVPAAPARDPGRFRMPPAAFISSLPAIRKEAIARARQRWSGYTTADALNYHGEYIEALVGILTALAAFFPANHFDDKPAREHFSEAIAARFRWHRAHLEPDGPGTRGTMIGPLAAAEVTADVEEMIVDLVGSLNFDPDHEPDFTTWKAAWDAAGS